MPLTTAARAAAAAPAGKVADAVDPLLAPYDLAAGAGGSGDLSFLFGGPSDDGTGLADMASALAIPSRLRVKLPPSRLGGAAPPTFASASACSDDSKHDHPSASGAATPSGARGGSTRARRAATGKGRAGAGGASATASPSTAGASRLARGGGGGRGSGTASGSHNAAAAAAAVVAAAAAAAGPSASGAATPSSALLDGLTHDPFDYDPFASDEELKAGGKRTRRRVTVATRDEETGRVYTQAEIRRMKRRITNRESARRMRLKRQEEWGIAKAQHRALRDERAKLAATVADAHAAAAAAAEDARKWQTLWRQAAAANLALSRRVAELGGGEVEPAAGGGSLDGGELVAPPPAAGAPVGGGNPNLLRGLSGLAASLLPSPRDGPSRPSSAGTPRSGGGGGRRRTNPGALTGGAAADLAAAGRAATAALPLPDDMAGLEFGGFGGL